MMPKIDNRILVEAESYLSGILLKKLADKQVYHNFEYALRLKKYINILSENCDLSKLEIDTIQLCALFYVSGYIYSEEERKAKSLQKASEFIAKHQFDEQTIKQVSELLNAVYLPQKPSNRLEEVLCDATQMYIAADDYYEQVELMYEEASMQESKSKNRNVFDLDLIRFFSAHIYFTDYGKAFLQPKKEKALARILDRMKRREGRKKKKLVFEKKEPNYSRGVETIFRLTARNQINLNSIADNKSNILISVNAIIISIIITMLAGNIGNMFENIIPIIVFLIICLVTIILAIMSTRPNIVNDNYSQNDLQENKVDLIFFGNFIGMEYDEYEKAVKAMIENDEHLYSTMIKNQYSLGKILAKKFRLVKIAYNVFMVGIIITVITFLITYLKY